MEALSERLQYQKEDSTLYSDSNSTIMEAGPRRGHARMWELADLPKAWLTSGELNRP